VPHLSTPKHTLSPCTGLSAEPYVSGVIRLSEQQGGILLIASDGLWDVTDAEAVTAAICQADRCARPLPALPCRAACAVGLWALALLLPIQIQGCFL